MGLYRNLWLCADASVNCLHEMCSMRVQNAVAVKTTCTHTQGIAKFCWQVQLDTPLIKEAVLRHNAAVARAQ